MGKRLIAVLFCFCLLATAAMADNFSFTGNFTQDDNVQAFNFTVGAPSTITLRAYSYAGGTNAAGTVIARGGFDTILALFNASGNLIGQNDDGGCSVVPHDAVSGMCWDTYLNVGVAAGNYTVTIMQYNNFARGPNIANGFVQQGTGNFTGPLTGHTGAFWDVAGTQRDSHWAFDILGVQRAQQIVPEPGSMMLLGTGLATLAGIVRRRLGK